MKKRIDLNEGFLTVQEVGELCRVSTRTVYRWIETGQIKGRKIGRKWLFTRDDLEEVLK